MARDYERVTITFEYCPDAFGNDEDDAIEEIAEQVKATFGDSIRTIEQELSSTNGYTTLFDAEKSCDNCDNADKVEGSVYCEGCAFLDEDEED